MKTNNVGSFVNKSNKYVQLFGDFEHDPYRLREKLVEPSICQDCGALYKEGRWRWKKDVNDGSAKRTRCTACMRLLENMPAGYVTIEGAFAYKIRGELLSMIHHLEAHEKSEHPLQRIMDIEEAEDRLLITTTDVHLAHGIGEALRNAYKGKLAFHYSKDKYVLRVQWQR